ncbi:uncharacterized protein VDAG_08668 [Verticillium dahliae VdLs.17]|uniref:DNA replication factor Cdt1 C-terminal domain-containing protein n=1 Tax=Verticillium dahliae (strain VdLs.17 / ATCC MYA-4575 / FGSC 10137) TaxID=498257 RepID=G2XET3_VERDV|nr:uncharacterized protein VDAG_08668 [Verticillium dahliae VdLs.17]EGY18334.1 hypothetical protein VDAG_08668 [Verticillium dahliae VdLs.17]
MARVASRRAVKPAVKPAASNSITNYTRLSKGQALAIDKLDKKVLAVCLPNFKPSPVVTVTSIHNSSDEENSKTTASRPSSGLGEFKSTPSKKRKATAEDETSIVPALTTTSKRQRIKSDGPKGDLPSAPACQTNRLTQTTITNCFANTTSTSTLRKTPKSTLISNAKDDGRAAARKVKGSKKPKTTAPPSKNAKDSVQQARLPAELAELLSLQRVILKTVTLQITHQKSNTPIDIKAITPDVSRTWGKRNVTIDDIQRCVAIQDLKKDAHNATASPFIITDYGRGKLCLEIDTERGTGRIDEDSLCKQFEENLHALCAERATDEMSDLDISFESLSFNDLPKADITMRHHLSAMKQNPLLAKGQRALTELKHGFVVKQQEKEAKAQAAKEPMTNTDGSKMSLLDRLRAKEIAAAQLGAPSGPEITRKRALQHVSDVSAIIGMLVNSSNPGKAPVKSFPMSVLQQKLKESLRVPMPVEEGVCTVKLIANEVAPEWLRVLPIGSKEHVVVQTRCKPCEAEISARVGRLC